MQNNVNNTPAPSKNEQKSKTLKVSTELIGKLQDNADVLMSIGYKDMDYSSYSTLVMYLLGKYAGKDEEVADNLVVITNFHFSLQALLGEIEETQHLAYELDGSNSREGILEKQLISLDALDNHRMKLVDKYTSMLRTYNVAYELNSHSAECEFMSKQLAKLQAEIDKLEADIEKFKLS